MPTVTASSTAGRRSSGSSTSKSSSGITYKTCKLLRHVLQVSSPKKQELLSIKNREEKAAYLLVKNSLDTPLESREEFIKALQHFGRNPTQHFVHKYWTSITEQIPFDDFCRILKDEPQDNEEDLMKAFRKIDKNKDGVISYEELKHILLKKGEVLTETEISEIFEAADLNSDGKIDYNEFLMMVQNTASDTKQAALRRLDRLEKAQRQQKAEKRRERTKEHREKTALLNGPHHKTSYPENGILQESPAHSATSSKRNSSSVSSSNDFSISLQLPAPNSEYKPGPDKKKLKGRFHTRCCLDPGEYMVLPYTTGCRFRPRKDIIDENKKSDLLQSTDHSGKIRLTKPFRMVLMNVFELFDLDDSGGLNREEFNLYNIRTGDEHVTDQEWEVVKTNFDTKDGELSMKGFIQLHQMEAEDGQGDTDDLWVSLQAVGYNYKLQMDEVCPYVTEIFAEDSPMITTVENIQIISSGPEWNAVLQYLYENSNNLHHQQQITVRAFACPFYSLFLFNQHTKKPISWKIDDKQSQNVVWAFSSAEITDRIKQKNVKLCYHVRQFGLRRAKLTYRSGFVWCHTYNSSFT